MLQPIYNNLSASVMLIESCYSNHPYRPLSYLFTISFFTYDYICNDLAPQYIFHHMLATFGIVTSYLWPLPDELFTIMCRVEISTLFLNTFRYINPKFKPIVQFLFFITFFKYRIYDLYYVLQNYSFIYAQFIPFLLFYTMNFYWFTLICKKIGDISCKPYNLTTLQHQLCSYTMAANSVITIYTLYPKYPFIQFASYLLALTNCIYYQDNTKKNKMCITLTLYLFKVSYLYAVYDYWYMLAAIHLLNIVCTHRLTNYTILISFGIDFLIGMYKSPSVELYTIFILQLFVQLIQPFYDLSDVCSHLLYIWYSYSRIKLLV